MEYIYVLTNKSTGRKYVGRSCVPEKRFRQHINALKSRRHTNELMQYDFERFGIDSFQMEIVDSSSNFTRTSLEGTWMLKLKTYDTKYGYNYKDPFVWSRHGRKTRHITAEEVAKKIYDRFEVVVKTSNADSAKKEYERQGYTVFRV